MADKAGLPAPAPASKEEPAPAAQASVSVVVPVYNAGRTVAELVQGLERVFRDHGVSDFEVVLVNDGSRDGSWEEIRRLGEQYRWVRGINLMRNYGQHNALLCGVRAARKRWIVTMDDDLQHPPDEVPALLRELAAGADVVYGTPVAAKHSFWRNLASRVTKVALLGTMGAETAGKVSAFRAFRADLRQAFADYRSPFVSLDVLLTWATTRFAAVPVRHDPRRDGASNYTLRQLFIHALNMMTGFSIWPLQLASLTGFFFTLFGLGVLAFVVGRFLIEGRVVPGFAFLASVIAIFSGAQLFALGIIGEYLARMHFRSMERPTYAVREVMEP